MLPSNPLSDTALLSITEHSMAALFVLCQRQSEYIRVKVGNYESGYLGPCGVTPTIGWDPKRFGSRHQG
jgi:hypothetical protein